MELDIVALTGLPELPGNGQPTVGETAQGMGFRLATRADLVVVGQGDGRGVAADQGDGPLLADIAPVFITGEAIVDKAMLAGAFGDRGSPGQALDAGWIGEALVIIAKEGEQSRANYIACLW